LLGRGGTFPIIGYEKKRGGNTGKSKRKQSCAPCLKHPRKGFYHKKAVLQGGKKEDRKKYGGAGDEEP